MSAVLVIIVLVTVEILLLTATSLNGSNIDPSHQKVVNKNLCFPLILSIINHYYVSSLLRNFAAVQTDSEVYSSDSQGGVRFYNKAMSSQKGQAVREVTRLS